MNKEIKRWVICISLALVATGALKALTINAYSLDFAMTPDTAPSITPYNAESSTPQQYVDSLISSESESITNISNITMKGDPLQFGSFNAFDAGKLGEYEIALDKGIVLSSGAAVKDSASIAGKGGDSDLVNLLNTTYGRSYTSNDAAVLEFDFQVDSGFTSVSFDFIYGSDEYPGWVGQFVDGTAIFVDGINYAYYKVGDKNELISAEYGTPFLNGASFSNLRYSGLIRPYRINALLNSTNTTHHIKIVVHDTSDTGVDSAIFVSMMMEGTVTTGGIVNPGEQTYCVAYDGNGNDVGSCPIDNGTYYTGNNAVVKEKGTLTRNGFAFSGWNTEPDGSGTTYEQGSTLTIGNSDVVLYALWEETQPVFVTGLKAANKEYDGNTMAELDFSGVLINGLEEVHDDVTLGTSASSAHFLDKNVGTSKVVTASGITLQGADADRYFIEDVNDLVANITQKEVKVTPISGQSKIFGQDDPTIIYTVEGLIDDDSLTGELGRFPGEKEGQYSITAGTLSNSNYTITLTNEIFTIIADETVPSIVEFTPYNGQTDVDVNELTITFNEKVEKGNTEGDIIVYKEDGSIFEKKDISNNRIMIDGEKLTFKLFNNLELNTTYYVEVDENIITDLSGNPFEGLEKEIWTFTTIEDSISAVEISGIDVAENGSQYPAVIRENDEYGYTVTVNKNTDGTVDLRVLPAISGFNNGAVLSISQAGIIIDGYDVKVTDTSVASFTLNVNIINGDGSVDYLRTYKLIVYAGSLEARIDNQDINSEIDAEDLKGAVDVTEEIEAGKNVELILTVKDNEKELTAEEKEQIQSYVTTGSSILYLNITLDMIVDNETTSITNTQNPVTIKMELPSSMRRGSNYKIIRIHNGDIELIEAVLDGNYLIFQTDRFSQYAITYTPKKSSSNTTIITAAEEEHEPYLFGYENETFQPEKEVTRGEVAAMIARLSKDYNHDETYTSQFTDVATGSWCENYIGYVKSKNIINGYNDESFRPQESITRAEAAAMISKFLNLTEIKDSIFSDCKGHWAECFIVALSENGVIDGYEDGTFRPDAKITRAEIVKILNAAMLRTPDKALIDEYVLSNEISLTDVSKDNWAYYEIIEALIKHNISDFH